MEITRFRIGKCIVLHCSGPLTLGPASMALGKAIREAVQDGTSRVIMNLKDVPSMDSGGLGEVISGYLHMTNQGGKLVLLNCSEKIQTMMAKMKLLGMFEFIDDEQTALDGCD